MSIPVLGLAGLAAVLAVKHYPRRRVGLYGQDDLFAKRPERKPAGSSHTADLPLFAPRGGPAPMPVFEPSKPRGGSQIDMFTKFAPTARQVFWVAGDNKKMSEDGVWWIYNPTKSSYAAASRGKKLELRRRTTTGDYVRVFEELSEDDARVYAQRAANIENS